MEMVLSLLKQSAKQKFFPRRLSSELFKKKIEKLEQEQARKLKKTREGLPERPSSAFSSATGFFKSFLLSGTI